MICGSSCTRVGPASLRTIQPCERAMGTHIFSLLRVMSAAGLQLLQGVGVHDTVIVPW
jgi:hypothetical protein